MAMSSIQVILLDIEGTICPISFVRRTLFPFALASLEGTLVSKWDAPEFANLRASFPENHRGTQEAMAAHVRELMEKDSKAPYLKALQGYIWRKGYEDGRLRAPLFPDVELALRTWRRQGRKIMVYSSGSVEAQRLLFAHTDTSSSDLTPWISGWFDTVNAGPKTNPSSYRTILASDASISGSPDGRGVPAGRWLFLSDNVLEVDAAIDAGMHAVVVTRPGNAELSESDIARHSRVADFAEIRLPPL